MEDPHKYWKFSLGDLREREHWKSYQRAYEDALSATSTSWAPWYVIPADHKWSARVLVAEVIGAAICSLELEYPKLDDEHMRELKKAKAALSREK